MDNNYKEEFRIVREQVKLAKKLHDLIQFGWKHGVTGEIDDSFVYALESFGKDRLKLALFYNRRTYND